MKSELTTYVKAMRKRTEGGGYMGLASLTAIEKCDVQRTIRINDKKKLYFIEPFSKETEDVKGDDSKTAVTGNKPIAAASMQSKEKRAVLSICGTI
ncbi:MAG: hypothetical protein ACXWWC_10555 [Chitinophagaceae bacterium]